MTRQTESHPTCALSALTSSIKVRNTKDVDEQAACLTGWNQCYEQMSPGVFEGSFESYSFDGVELFNERANQVIQQYGLPQANTMTVAYLEGRNDDGHFCGMHLKQGNYFFLRGGKEFHFRTPSQTRLSAVSVDTQAFGEYCERVGEYPPLGSCMDNGFLPDRPATNLAQLLQNLTISLRASPGMLDHPTLRRCLVESLHSTVLTLCAPTENVHKDLTASCRQYVIRKARSYMFEHIDQPITISDLCAHTRVSRRTLQYAFQEVLGTNPTRYLRVMRLNGARRDIRRQTSGHTVLADIAAKWGFWHPSRFASDYKSLFGELPSHTLSWTLAH